MTWLIKISAIISIATIVVVAMCNKIDGVVYVAGVSAITGLAGYEFGKQKGEKNGRKKE